MFSEATKTAEEAQAEFDEHGAFLPADEELFRHESGQAPG